MSGGAQKVVVKVPTTLAIRWLIPRLAAFRDHWPDVAISIETFSGTGLPSGSRADLSIAYFPLGSHPPGAEVIAQDQCRPYLSPQLHHSVSGKQGLSAIPALQCAQGNWDWVAWLDGAGLTGKELRFGGHFDLDDAALRAAIAGMGMVLAPEFIIQDDLDAGRLIPVPDAPKVTLGCYTLHRGGPATTMTERFVRWLRANLETRDL